jgi:hypothetical protein
MLAWQCCALDDRGALNHKFYRQEQARHLVPDSDVRVHWCLLALVLMRASPLRLHFHFWHVSLGLCAFWGIMESFCRVCIVWIRCWFADESLPASLLACLTRPLCFLFDEILCFSLASSDAFHVEVTASMLVLLLQSLFWYKLWTRSAWQTDAFSDYVLRAQSVSESDCLDAVFA